MHTLLCSNCVKASFCTTLFPFFVTKTDVSNNRLSNIGRVTRTNYWLKSCSATMVATVPSYCYSFLSDSTLYSIGIGTGGELNGTIFLSLDRLPFTILAMNDVPRRKTISRFYTVLNMTRTPLSPIWAYNTIVQTTSNFRLVTSFSLGLSLGHTDGGQSCWTRFTRSKLGPAPVSKVQLIGRIRHAVRQNEWRSCSLFS